MADSRPGAMLSPLSMAPDADETQGTRSGAPRPGVPALPDAGEAGWGE